MRGAVSVNLASEPFRRDRPFVLSAIGVSTLLAGLLSWQVTIGMIERDSRGALDGQIAVTGRQLMTLRADVAKLQAAARDPRFAEAVDYSMFLNGLLRRKSISWTRIFEDLEGVMPHDVRLIAVRPQVNLDNQILLDMTVAAQAPEPVVELFTKIEASERFGSSAVSTWVPPSQSETQYRCRLTANYAPKL
jgi:hypothetical protein